jgi:hypothetical protein
VAVFNQGNYTIYQRKEITGDTPMSPQSPTNDMAVSNHSLGRKTALLAGGALVAQSVIGAVRSEVEATTGDEVLQSSINNALMLGGYGLVALKGGPLAVLGIGIKGTVDEIRRQRDIYRRNYATELENKLRGRRVAIGKGSVYYGD